MSRSDLTKRFIERFPNVFLGLNNPIAYGGTPLRASLREQKRLVALPPIFYSNPVLTSCLKNYDPITFYAYLIELFEAIASNSLKVKKAYTNIPWKIKLAYALRAMYVKNYISDLRIFLILLRDDKYFLRFHEGKSNIIPEYYQYRLSIQLGILRKP